MKPRTLARLLAAYAVGVVLLVLGIRSYVAERPMTPFVVRGAHDATAIAEGPLSIHPWLFTLALVPGLDGVRAELDGKVAWVTVDDLIALQAYDHELALAESFGIGTHRATVLHLLAGRLGTTPAEVERRAALRRVRFDEPRRDEPVTPALVRESVREAARYLARSVDDTGRFRYVVLATTNQTLTGYNWPRHSGATYFLAQAAAELDDPDVRYAALRAASRLRDDTMVDCGAHRCIADDDRADVGSSALALLAFAELVRTGADASYRPAVASLASFLRSQQRADGELLHAYDRTNKRPVDVHYLYFTGEAALALARAHAITGAPEDLEAAKRALAYLVGPGWSFFGSRYYFGEEHWTCQAMAELWDRAPNADALAFCLRWHQYQRRLQYDGTDSPFDADGAFGVGPIASPRLTPASSRAEAAAATLAIARKVSHPDEPALDAELRRAVGFVTRHQLRPGTATDRTWSFADPEAVRGAMPGSPVDLYVRIDYPQHAGSMMIRWLELERRR